MTPRLMHTKSRAGCTRCKARKVKCDEGKPICGACQKHSVECIYPPTTPSSNRSAPHRRRSRSPTRPADQASQSDSTTSGAFTVDTLIPGVVHDEAEGISLPESAERRLLELHMMQLYMRSFQHIFAYIHEQEMVDVWQNAVPNLAIKNPFLLHALIAITALYYIVTNREAKTAGDQQRAVNRPSAGRRPRSPPFGPLAITDPDPFIHVESLEQVRALYFNLAVAGHRKAIANLNPSNADSVCMATILISHSGFLLTHDLTADATTYAPPVKWLWLASGINTMIAEATPILSPDTAIMRIISSVGGDNLGEEMNLDSNGIFFSPLIDFQRDSESEQDLAIYGRVTNLMGMIRTGFLREEASVKRLRKTMSFASLVPTEFITFVSEHRPRALSCLACFFAMAKENEHIWWFHGAAEMHVLGLQTLVPESWQTMLKWAIEIVSTPTVGQRSALWQRSKMNALL